MENKTNSNIESHPQKAGIALLNKESCEIKQLSDPVNSAPTPERIKPEGYDPFDLKTIRQSQSYLAGAAEKLINSYSVRKPKKNAFFRVHPGQDYQVSTFIYVDKDEVGMEKETYFLDPNFSLELEETDLSTLFQYVTMHLAIERHAEKPFVWPVRQPTSGGKDNEFWRTAREAAEMGKTKWLRISAGEGSYNFYLPKIKFADPNWPNKPFKEILRIAFKSRVIDGPEHPVMKAFWGEE